MLLQLSKTVKQSPKSPQIFENNGTFCADRPFSKNRSETNCQKSFVFNQLVSELQSYILSTTTETSKVHRVIIKFKASIVHPFNNNWNEDSARLLGTTPKLQSYILSTTTETTAPSRSNQRVISFNRTSFQQQLKLSKPTSIVAEKSSFNRTSFQQQLKLGQLLFLVPLIGASIVHPFNNNWNNAEFRKLRP